jgi:large subunit ribosomal protein L5
MAAQTTNAAKKATAAQPTQTKAYVPRLKKFYREKVTPELFDELGYTSTMQVPRLEKIVVSMGVGEARDNKKLLDAAISDLETIVGQHAIKTKAKKSIANFKIRKGQEIGARVTLRGNQMWEFLDRLMNVALPRVKDFRGVNPNGFDGHGDYTLGLTEQIIFPEIDFDKIEKVMGLSVSIVTTAETDMEAKSLLAKLGMPFRK